MGGSGGSLATLQFLGEAFKKSHPEATTLMVSSLGGGGKIKALRAVRSTLP